MKLKAPPVLQVFFFGFLMWLLKSVTKVTHFNFAYQEELSWIIFILAMVIGLLAVYSFRKARTSVDPLHPEKASKLVVKGLYNYTRNPMYLALLLVLLAFFLRLGSLYNIITMALYVLYITEFQIKPEEKALTELFGEQYLEYKSKVRRWI